VRARPAAQVHVSPAAVRAWAQANGFAVGDRGRLPLEVTDAYRRADQLTAEH
jgi:DNA polymerase-3 subunit epsilon